MTPNWSCSIQFHILAETMVGIAQGMRMTARMRPRPGKAALRMSATTMPSTVSRETETRVNHTVFQTECHQSGSVSSPSHSPS